MTSLSTFKKSNDTSMRRAILSCKRPFIFFTFALLLAVFTSKYAFANDINQYHITSSYIYNFAKNIDWPNERELDSFNIALYQHSNPTIYNELSKLAKVKKIKNLPIHVKAISSIEALKSYQIVHIENADKDLIDKIYDTLSGAPTLIITNNYTDKQFVMINMILADGNRMRFEVNKANLINHGLSSRPELILLGGTEIDVAQLFRKGQASLVSMQKSLKNRENKLAKLNSEISQQEQKNRLLEQSLKKVKDKIQRQNNALSEREKSLAQANQNITLKNQELSKSQQAILKSKTNLEFVIQKVKQKENELIGLSETISQQKTDISELDELVESQQKAIIYSYDIVALAVIFGITLLFGYTIKRRDNLRLNVKTHELQTATEKLKMAKKIAEQANQAKSRFLSLMSHELRTPLQAIIGYTDVVLEEMRLNGDITYEEDLTRVLNNSERLLKLINGVLDLAKIESGKMDIDLIEVYLDKLIDEALSNVRPQIEKNGNTIETQINSSTKAFEADYDKLLHIVLNLLSNAGKFTHDGSIFVTAGHSAHQLFIRVKDTGIGLSKEQTEHIFDQFKQADSSTTRLYGGTGLGLAITKQYTELMGGKINVMSTLGEGTEFTINIPLPIRTKNLIEENIDKRHDAKIAASTIKKQYDSNNCVLIIDDDPAFTDILSRTLTEEGYQVYSAETALEGLKLAEKVHPDLITLDILLPDQHGFDVYKQIKETPSLKNIPIIVASIYDKKSQDDAFIVDVYLTKPISRIDLKSALKKLAPINPKIE